jgi:hypothetical protein
VRVESDAKVIVGNYTSPEHDAYIAGLHNRGRLNHVLEIAGVTYGPGPVPGSDAFTEVSKKRKTDFVGKASSKLPKAPKKRKAETVKTSVPRGKKNLKRPSDAEVASVKPLKLSKNIVPHAIAVVATTHPTLKASSPKSMTGAPDSKVVGGTSGSKPGAGSKKTLAPVRNRRVPVIGASARASLEESQESSPPGQTSKASPDTNALRPKPHGTSSRVSLPDLMPSVEPEASLQIIALPGTGGAHTGYSAVLFVCLHL